MPNGAEFQQVTKQELSDLISLCDTRLEQLFWTPTRTGAMSAWWGHVPFAHWLVSALAPRTIVELGTHNGVSFAAFCEAVQRTKLPTQCFAIDTWEGDEHAGLYGEEVFADLRNFIRDHYNGFAELMRMTFDKGLSYFSEGSIDLLHIDGLHTYQAVKRDFENWKPKLSDKAVVLFHDTNVHDRDFGVWRLWHELQQQYPSFTFQHGHGLGLAAVGTNAAPSIALLCKLGEQDATLLRARVAQLGERWVINSTLSQLERHTKNLELETSRQKQSLVEYAEHSTNLEAERTRLLSDVAVIRQDADTQIAALRSAQETQIAALQSALETQIAALQSAMSAQEQLTQSRAADIEALSHAFLEDERKQSRINALSHDLASHQQNVERLQGENALHRKEAAAQKHLVTSITRASSRREEQLSELRETNATQESILIRTMADYDALHKVFDTQWAQERSFRSKVHLEIAAARSRHDEIEAVLCARLGAARAEFAAIYTSTSWRVTSLIRAMKQRAGSSRTPGLSLTAVPLLGAIDWPSMEPAPDHVISQGNQPEAGLIEADSSRDSDVIRQSGLFDEAFYAGRLEARGMRMDPLSHYLKYGEHRGLSPSEHFDPAFYKARHTDLAGCGLEGLLHYVLHGREEGRTARAIADLIDYPIDGIAAGLSTVIVAVHEATRTGAAILAWNIIKQLRRRYNVVALLRQGGPIEHAIADAASSTVRLPDTFVIHDAETDFLARRLKERYGPKYAIANSTETRYYVPSLEREGVPVIALIHEFSSNVRPLGTLHALFASASEIVFSARITAESSLADYHALPARAFHILPQGACALPALEPGTATGEMKEGNSHRTFLDRIEKAFLVVGLGTITIRKGVDFFIATAAAFKQLHPNHDVKFVWIGQCYWYDQPYLDYCTEQVKRSGLGASFEFSDEFDDLSPVYDRANACLLSSRLDPLPNIAIDCAVHGVPVVCFDQASGMADILKASLITRELVVSYLNAEAAAKVISDLARDSSKLAIMSQAMIEVAHSNFDMLNYVNAIDSLGLGAAQRAAQSSIDLSIITAHEVFDANLYLGARASTMTPDSALRHYLHASRLVAPRGRLQSGILLRRPLAGFHPLVYAAENPSFDETSGQDPLAHYLQSGLPQGRWTHEVLTPETVPGVQAATLSVLVHAHFHYVELVDDFLNKLLSNEITVDLIITTTSEEHAREISSVLSRRSVQRATVLVTPNRGRDIGAMLSGLGNETISRYDVVGHFHGKRSPHVEADVGETWRNFLLQHLVGDDYKMMDFIIEAFASDRNLGLVFAEDPHLNDWDQNVAMAAELALRMGLELPLPNHFDFPLGTMFWARSLALKPMLDLNLTWDSYPEEPVPIDGSCLHALERLIPFSATHAGFSYKTTHLDDWTR